jgi:hypothetical protein
MNLTGLGGVPRDNQGLEAKNKALKDDQDYRRDDVVVFLYSLADWLENESIGDRSFGETFSKQAWNRKLFYNARVIIENTLVLECGFKFHSKKSSIRRGVIIPSCGLLRKLSDEIAARGGTVDVCTLKIAISAADGGEEPWLDTFKNLMRKPVETVSCLQSARAPPQRVPFATSSVCAVCGRRVRARPRTLMLRRHSGTI